MSPLGAARCRRWAPPDASAGAETSGPLARARGISGIGDDLIAEDVIDLLEHGRIESDAARLDVLAHLVWPSRAGDGGRDSRILERPRDRELRQGQACLLGDGLQLLYPAEELVGQQPRDEASALLVGGSRPGRGSRTGLVLPGQHALGDR